MTEVFHVRRKEIIYYHGYYSRDEVLDFMSLPDSGGLVDQAIRAEYAAMDNEELALAFHQELRGGASATFDAVIEDTERNGDVDSNSLSVELE